MGRHTAPKSQQSVASSASNEASGWRWPDRAPQRQADPVAWWRQASPSRRAFAVAAVAGPVLALVVVGNAGGTSHSTSASPAESARLQGAHYAEQLRDSGQSTLSINVNCMANTGGYSGTNFDDYQQGCVGVTMDMTASGSS